MRGHMWMYIGAYISVVVFAEFVVRHLEYNPVGITLIDLLIWKRVGEEYIHIAHMNPKFVFPAKCWSS
jgi:hypothetical protein